MNLKKYYPKRKDWIHKGQSGYILVVSGSRQYSGSAIFNAVSALRAGADLVEIAGYKRAMDIAASYLPDVITYPLEEELNLKQAGEILELSKKFDSLVIGCGLERNDQTNQAIREIIRQTNLPAVVDAQAIWAVAEERKILKNKKIVVTPHSKEFEVLTGETVGESLGERNNKVKKWAKELGSVILLKGHIDVISDGKRIALNKTGNPYMTKGGFGDTLSGICGALLARGIEPFEAAQAAAYINGKAGELASKKHGESVLASDLFEFLPEVLKGK